jgi:hypothetical protein
VVNDFEAVALLPSNNQLIIGSNATPVNNLPELTAWGASSAGVVIHSGESFSL